MYIFSANLSTLIQNEWHWVQWDLLPIKRVQDLIEEGPQFNGRPSALHAKGLSFNLWHLQIGLGETSGWNPGDLLPASVWTTLVWLRTNQLPMFLVRLCVLLFSCPIESLLAAPVAYNCLYLMYAVTRFHISHKSAERNQMTSFLPIGCGNMPLVTQNIQQIVSFHLLKQDLQSSSLG